VPAFTLGVPAPLHATVTSPTVAPATAFDRADPVPLEWTSGSADFAVSFIGGTPKAGLVSVYCTFNGDAGEGEVPAAALSDLPVGDGTFSAATINLAGDAVAGWELTLRLVDVAEITGPANGYAVHVPVTFE
jgi:hypothetical protein